MPEIKFKTVFDWGDMVYVKTDTEQVRGIIVAISKDWNGGLNYKVRFCDEYSWYQAIELSLEKGEVGEKKKQEEDEDE